jgi:hypothetical protein
MITPWRISVKAADIAQLPVGRCIGIKFLDTQLSTGVVSRRLVR